MNTSQRLPEIVHDYLIGVPVKDIFRKYAIGKDCLYLILDEAGVARRNQRHSDETRRVALALHASGARLVDISRELKIAPGNIYNWTNEARMSKKKGLSIEAYEKELRWFEQAVSSPRGIKITCADDGTAINTRMRLNKLRAAIRRQNASVYPPDHELHGVSPFDIFTIAVEGNKIVMTKKKAAVVEEL